MSIEETEINQDITMDRFFNISLVGTFQSGQCKGHHICYTETFDSFYVMGKRRILCALYMYMQYSSFVCVCLCLSV